nr:hypothetical protein [Tanacetum cinerariifolium]
ILVIHVVPIAPADPLVAPEVGAVFVISTNGVLDLVDYSFYSDSDTSKDSLPVALELPLVSPFYVLMTRMWTRFLSDLVRLFSSVDLIAPTFMGRVRFDASGQSHLEPSTRVASPRLVDPSVRTLRCSEDFMRWRSAPLSTLYPPTTSESSPNSYSERSLDSSSPSTGPSPKICRSLTTLVPSCTPVSRSIAPALADLSPHKRLRDSYSSEVSREEHMEIGTADAETVADLGIGDGVRAPTKDGIGMRVKVATSDIRDDEEEFEAEASAGGTMEITVDPLGTSSIFEPTGGDDPDLKGTLYDIYHYMSEVPFDMITEFETAQRQLEADNLRLHMTLSQEEFCQICRDRDDTQRRLRRLGNGNDEGGNDNSNGNENEGGNGNGNHNENDRDARPVVRECTYQDFMKCEPLSFKGTKRVICLIRWFEKMETIFHISNCPEKYQVKELMKLLAEVYCPRTKIQKMESKLLNLTMKNNDLATYSLSDNIQGNVIATEPTRLQDAVRMANNLIDQKLKGYAIKNAKNKRKFENSQKDNPRQQPPFKRQNVRGHNVARAYTADNNDRRVYNGALPLCNKCKFHHEWPCTVRYGKCNQRVLTCFECGRQGHYMSDFPKLKEQKCGNTTRNKSRIGEAKGKAYVLGGGDANPDSNVVTSTFLLNNHYASVLFDSGTDQSFVSTTFSTLLDIIPDTLDVSYAVELVDERTSKTNTILRGCVLGFLGHPLNIDLMPVELGSFDVIIGMDYLANHHAMIVCDEKIVWIPYRNEV